MRPVTDVIIRENRRALILLSLKRKATSRGPAMESPRKRIRIAINRVMIRTCIRNIPA